MNSSVFLATLFGVCTAISNALAVITQHVASSRLPSRGRGWRFVLDLLRQPLWLLGWFALAGSLVFQALALHFGSVGLVQPLLISELVIALIIRRAWFKQRLKKSTVLSSIATSALLAAFIVYAAPHGGRQNSNGSTWLLVLVVGSLSVGALILGARNGSPRKRAGLFGMATALSWAVEAALIKSTTDSIAASGFLGALAHWPIYAFVICGVVGLYCEQSALHVGPLGVSQPLIVIFDPLVSVALGALLFAERWPGGVIHTTVGLFLLVLISLAAWIVIRTGPETMTAN